MSDAMTNDYAPIDCDQHSVLELLAMRRTPVVARFTQRDESVVSAAGVVCDVITRDGAEYLILQDPPAKQRAIRLDRLLSLSEPAGRQIWRQKNVSSD